jgi:hypothetical protein
LTVTGRLSRTALLHGSLAPARLRLVPHDPNIELECCSWEEKTREAQDMELSQTIWPPDAVIRQLRPSDRTKFADHLLRLDAAARHDRFNGGLGDAFLRAYAERSFAQGSTVVGFVVDGEVHGAAEIHEQAGEAEPTAEIAFSVEPAYQHIGVGTL